MMFACMVHAMISAFEDFDKNRDGLVTFQEWQQYLYEQQQVRTSVTQG